MHASPKFGKTRVSLQIHGDVLPHSDLPARGIAFLRLLFPQTGRKWQELEACVRLMDLGDATWFSASVLPHSLLLPWFCYVFQRLSYSELQNGNGLGAKKSQAAREKEREPLSPRSRWAVHSAQQDPLWRARSVPQVWVLVDAERNQPVCARAIVHAEPTISEAITQRSVRS